LTGGAALAVAGAVAGTGAAVSAGTVATVVAGGVVAGAGLNLAQQGAQIKDGVVDPATGKKKTDINFGDVAKSGAIGGVMAPVGAAAFGLAPVAVGALGLVGGGQGVKSGIENVQKGHNWSAALDFGTAAMAAAPFATKGGRNAMFGAQARARTAQTGSQIFNGAKNLGTQAWGGVKNLGAQGLSGVKNFGAQAFKGAQNLGDRALTSAGNWGSRTLSGAGNWGTQAMRGARNGVLHIEEQANQAMDRNPLLNKWFPRGGNGPKGGNGLKPAVEGVGEQQGTISTATTPEHQPTKIQGNQTNNTPANEPVSSTPSQEGSKTITGAKTEQSGAAVPKGELVGQGQGFTPKEFPTPELIQKTNDPIVQKRMGNFVDLMSKTANDFTLNQFFRPDSKRLRLPKKPTRLRRNVISGGCKNATI
jgi:hypothetical protein